MINIRDFKWTEGAERLNQKKKITKWKSYNCNNIEWAPKHTKRHWE